MKPKSKLMMLSTCFLAVAGFLVWCWAKNNMFGVIIDTIILLYYLPQIVWTYKDMNHGQRY